MTPPKAVVFDIGNVLLEWNPDKLFGRLIPDAQERRDFYDTCEMSKINDAIDLGAPFKQTIYDHAERHPARAPLIRAWHDHWLEMATPTIDGSVAILRSLRRAGTPVFALSNFGVDSFVLAEATYPVLAEFDGRIISGYHKCIKPDPKIYELLETLSGLSGSDLFFIDDRADNIESAKSRGWHGHLFENPEQLRKELLRHGMTV